MSVAKITIETVEEAWNKYSEYKDRAEQHEFPLLIMIDLELKPLYDHLKVEWNPRLGRSFLKAMAKVGEHYGFDIPEVDV